MKKTFVLLGSSIVMLGVLNSGAEARKVSYEIGGKRYSYSTNNKAQTAEAKKRIEAAEAAKARADAEKAESPLKAVFGSPTQREAKEAREKLQQVLSDQDQDTGSSQSSLARRAERRGKRQDVVREASVAS